jgi:hypothetical protein
VHPQHDVEGSQCGQSASLPLLPVKAVTISRRREPLAANSAGHADHVLARRVGLRSSRTRLSMMAMGCGRLRARSLLVLVSLIPPVFSCHDPEISRFESSWAALTRRDQAQIVWSTAIRLSFSSTTAAPASRIQIDMCAGMSTPRVETAIMLLAAMTFWSHAAPSSIVGSGALRHWCTGM